MQSPLLASMPNVNRMFRTSGPDITANVMRLWRREPMIFAKDCFDFVPDTWQEDVSELYKEHQRIAMICGKGPGKTALLAILGWHFFLTNKLPKIGVLSFTKDQLMANLWAELCLWRYRSKFASAVTEDGRERITLRGHEKFSFIDARSYKIGANESEQASALAGLHADNVAFLIDEAGEIPDGVLVTADAALSGKQSDTTKGRLLVTANPVRPAGLIYKASEGLSQMDWKIFHVTGDPDDPNRASRVSKEWARAQIAEFGIDSDYVLVNVFGRYPTIGDSQLLTLKDIIESMNRVIDDDAIKNAQVRIGVDVARGGVDSTIIAIRQGRKIHKIVPLKSSYTSTEVAAQVIFLAKEYNADKVYVDDTGGYGSGVVDNLQYQHGFVVEGVNYARSASDKDRFVNVRSEMYLRLRDWVKSGGKLPNDSYLKNDLLTPKLIFRQGKFLLEAKEDIRKRLGRSPDRSDALAQTFVDEEMPKYGSVMAQVSGDFSGGYVCGLEDESGRGGYVNH